jgi:hypothetical protein
MLATAYDVYLTATGCWNICSFSCKYKKGVCERSRFLVEYSVDEVDFLEIC